MTSSALSSLVHICVKSNLAGLLLHILVENLSYHRPSGSEGACCGVGGRISKKEDMNSTRADIVGGSGHGDGICVCVVEFFE